MQVVLSEADRTRLRKSAPSRVAGEVVQERPEARVFLARLNPTGSLSKGELEELAWAAVPVGKAVPDDAPVAMLESYVFRGPAWKATGPDGRTRTIKAGEWLAAFGCSKAAWAEYKNGRLAADDALRMTANPQITLKKGTKMGKKKLVAKAAAHGTLTPSEANAAMALALSKMSAEVAKAESDGNVYLANQIRRDRTLLKLALGEQAYLAQGAARDPRGRALFKNTSAAGPLGEDTSVGGF